MDVLGQYESIRKRFDILRLLNLSLLERNIVDSLSKIAVICGNCIDRYFKSLGRTIEAARGLGHLINFV